MEKEKENLTEKFKLYAVICAVCEKEGITIDKNKFEERLGQLAAQNNQDTESLRLQIQTAQKCTAEDYFAVQFLYQDFVKLIVGKATVNEGERPTEAPTTSSAVETETAE